MWAAWVLALLWLRYGDFDGLTAEEQVARVLELRGVRCPVTILSDREAETTVGCAGTRWVFQRQLGCSESYACRIADAACWDRVR
jgi:hypothetical protein